MLKNILRIYTCALGFLFFVTKVNAQTDQDALMMAHNNLCVAGIVNYNSWTDYWEGTFKRDNANLGRFSTRSATLMLNYGIKDNLNFLVAIPYISNKVSQGTLMGLDGFQDVSMFIKWRPLKIQQGKNRITFYTVGGFSAPVNNYNIELMPIAIGSGSNVLSGRITADFQRSWFFATLSGAYQYRSNVKLDRPAYYTTHQINSNEVQMPNSGNVHLRSGYRSSSLIAQAFIDQMLTFGGFDMRKNDMPFLSNRMQATRLGLEAKYSLQSVKGLEFLASSWTIVAGRNMGQATGVMAGVNYIIDFQKK
jgi:hypothetical protein